MPQYKRPMGRPAYTPMRGRMAKQGRTGMFRKGVYSTAGDVHKMKRSHLRIVKWTSTDRTANGMYTAGDHVPAGNGTVSDPTGVFILKDVAGANTNSFFENYDQYRITGVRVTFIPGANQADITGSTPFPLLHVTRDYDSWTTDEATLASMINRPDYKCYRLDRPVSVFVRNPKFLTTINTLSSTTNGDSTSKSQGWLTTAGGGPYTKHFGLIFRVEEMGGADLPVGWTCRVKYDYYIDLKNQK